MGKIDQTYARAGHYNVKITPKGDKNSLDATISLQPSSSNGMNAMITIKFNNQSISCLTSEPGGSVSRVTMTEYALGNEIDIVMKRPYYTETGKYLIDEEKLRKLKIKEDEKIAKTGSGFKFRVDGDDAKTLEYTIKVNSIELQDFMEDWNYIKNTSEKELNYSSSFFQQAKKDTNSTVNVSPTPQKK